jgi:hypothetical protein
MRVLFGATYHALLARNTKSDAFFVHMSGVKRAKVVVTEQFRLADDLAGWQGSVSNRF